MTASSVATATMPVPPRGRTLEFDEHDHDEHVIASLLAISDGVLGTRAVSETADARLRPGETLASGLWGPEPEAAMLTFPAWTALSLPGRGRRWRLDVDRGVVEHEIVGGAQPLRAVRLALPDRPGIAVLNVAPAPDGQTTTDLSTAHARSGDGTSVVLAVGHGADVDGMTVVAALAHGATRHGTEADARAATNAVLGQSFPSVAAEAHTAWQDRWHDAAIGIDGDSECERCVQFAVFHLLQAARTDQPAAVGPRGITGTAYEGHVMWDADVFVLPALAAIMPSAARSMLAYRSGRLHPAHEAACQEGRHGARFPWESAQSGRDVTPTRVIGPGAAPIDVLTGEQELHICADIVWAAIHYTQWSGDDDFLANEATTLAVETARYLADRIELDTNGQAHVREVIGPDEYHIRVDDNAYTNQMVRWTLRTAADLTERFEPGVTEPEPRRWRDLSTALVDGYDPRSRLHEQFSGFHELDPVPITSIADPPVAADLLLGVDLAQRSQVIKQADVVMLHHLLRDEVPGSMARDVDHYLPLTAHGSSLSPAIHAAVLARIGRADEALPWFRLAGHIDLQDLTGTAAGGLHLAAMGGLWQALAYGFLGVWPQGRRLVIEPHLPATWERVRLRCRHRGIRLEISAEHDRVIVHSEAPVTVATASGRSTRGTRSILEKNHDEWNVQ